jgi:hypothetical protein
MIRSNEPRTEVALHPHQPQPAPLRPRIATALNQRVMNPHLHPTLQGPSSSIEAAEPRCMAPALPSAVLNPPTAPSDSNHAHSVPGRRVSRPRESGDVAVEEAGRSSCRPIGERSAAFKSAFRFATAPRLWRVRCPTLTCPPTARTGEHEVVFASRQVGMGWDSSALARLRLYAAIRAVEGRGRCRTSASGSDSLAIGILNRSIDTPGFSSILSRETWDKHAVLIAMCMCGGDSSGLIATGDLNHG